ncbi:MAG: acetyl-CoA carboxylase carboxyl transferase subunit alpha, partial [Candidatus Omnitrophica bacterium]|nr:acetyl-CoA carboxylase carboxyl transferase subunit alpha [Candidatus Omnitrophota bacterium]
AFNLREMTNLATPIIGFVIGEGGSGGALGIGVVDKVYVLENAYYSVISPEGCAAILWKDRLKSDLAAQALKITANELVKLGLIDGVVKEPMGGAHKEPSFAANNISKVIKKELPELLLIDKDLLLKKRYEKYRNIGKYCL